MQDFKRFLAYIASKRRTEQLKFFNWLSNVKNLVLSNGSEYVQNVINGIKLVFFSKKLQKVGQRLGASPPDPPSLWWLRDPPQTPFCDTFELQCASFLKHDFQFRYFRILTIGFNPLP